MNYFLGFLGSSLLIVNVLQAESPMRISGNPEPYKGLSAYSALNPKFPCDKYVELSTRVAKPAMAVLWGTFGKDISCVDKFIKANSSKPNLLEIHFSNETCHRYPRKCFYGELKSYGIRTIQKRIYQIKALIEPLLLPNTKVILSMGLEDNYLRKRAKRLYSIIKSQWPYFIARSPDNDPYLPNRHMFIEHHGLYSSCTRATIANNDGSELGMQAPREFYKRHASCLAVFLWLPGLQGSEKKFTPPLTRSFKFSREDLRSAREFLQ